jgi:DNA primase
LKKAKQKEKIEYVILCEGYMDVIAMHMAGYNTAVASMGTSLTSQQAKILHRYAPLVYICYDGDAAGQKATLRGLDILEENGLEIKVIVLPEGLDPDDVIKAEGAEGFKKKYLEKALPLMRYKLEVLKKDFDLNSQDGKSKYAVKAVAEASRQKDYVSIEAALKIIQSITGFTFESLKAQLNMSVEGVRPILVEEKKDNLQSKAIKYLLWAIINNKDYAHKDFRLDKLPLNDFYKSIFSFAQSGKDIRRIYIEFDESVHNDLGEILDFGEQFSQDPIIQKQYYDGFYAQLLLEVLEQDREELSKQYDVETDEHKKRTILDQMKKLLDKINQIKTKGV